MTCSICVKENDERNLNLAGEREYIIYEMNKQSRRRRSFKKMKQKSSGP